MNSLLPRSSRPVAQPPVPHPKQPPGPSRAPANVNEGCRGKSRERHSGYRPPRTRSRRSAALDPRPAFPLAALLTQMPFIRAIRGRMGDLVFKTYGRKIVVTRVPNFAGYVPSPAQRARRARMSGATAYAKLVYAHPTAKALYLADAKKLHRQPFRLAVSDYLTDHPRVTQVASLCAPLTLRLSNPVNGHPPFALRRPQRSPAVRVGEVTHTRRQPPSDSAHQPSVLHPPASRRSRGLECSILRARL